MGNDPSPRPGFDYWVSFPGQGRIINPDLYENGKLDQVQGYITDLLTDRSLKFIRDQRNSSSPFFLYLAHKAVHPDTIQRNDGSVDNEYGARYIPAERHKGRYQNEIFPRAQIKKSAMEGALGSAMVQKFLERKASPEIMKEFGSRLDPGTSEQTIRERAEMILSIDEGLGNILAELEESGRLDNTLIVFTSDNGYFFGEHGLSLERRLPYEEAIRSPLLVRYPGAIKAGMSVESLVSMIDIAPSILQFGQANIGKHVQGISFAPLLASGYGKKGRRSSVLIENFSDDLPYPWVLDADYKAIRNEDYKYIHWNMHPEYDELYDLQNDPQEQVNILDTSVGRRLSPKLRTELAQLVRQSISL